MKSLKPFVFAALIAALSFVHSSTTAQTSRDHTVLLTAQVSRSPAQITLQWVIDTQATGYTIFRRDLGASNWSKQTTTALAPSATAWTDTKITVGKLYEYKVLKNGTFQSSAKAYSGLGFICSGVDANVSGIMGTVILMVDDSFSTSLAPELARLEADLHLDGWQVVRHDVSRSAKVTDVKALILADYNNDPQRVRSLFLFGHVPVPYSGDFLAVQGHYYPPDGHDNHGGAWPADNYYGEVDGDWTDVEVTNEVGFRAENKNIPGDGKFDQIAIPDDIDLEVGRVDFAKMPAFIASEKDLLKQYLDRDHAWRTRQLVVPRRALVNINFGYFNNDYDDPGEDAWRNFPPFVGKNIDIVNDVQVTPATASAWFSKIDTAAYLWAYGCGPGSFESCGGVGTSNQYAQKGARAVFFMQFGSYFGDWDSQDNLLRAALATTNALSSCWVGRPFWFFHPFAAGQTLGYCTKLTQNNETDYRQGIGTRQIHVALMGDPTLRLDYPSAPTAPSAVVGGINKVDLTWTAPAQLVAGYNVYRASGVNKPLTKISTQLIAGTTFTDTKPLEDSNVYLIRAVVNTENPSLSYLSESPGVAVAVSGVQTKGFQSRTSSQASLRVNADAHHATITLIAGAGVTKLAIYDLTGRLVKQFATTATLPGTYTYDWDYTTSSNGVVSSGTYIVRAEGARDPLTSKIVVTR